MSLHFLTLPQQHGGIASAKLNGARAQTGKAEVDQPIRARKKSAAFSDSCFLPQENERTLHKTIHK